jgi:hypothetical protein
MATQPVNPSAQTNADQAGRAWTNASSELLFVFLPFIVIGMTLAHQGKFCTILFIPEWSIVSAVIAGQAIVKLVSASVGKKSLHKENFVLVISLLLVGILVPVLTILAIVLTSPNVSVKLAVAQAVLFILSGIVFWGASALAHDVL